jgi:hypothetical protein
MLECNWEDDGPLLLIDSKDKVGRVLRLLTV